MRNFRPVAVPLPGEDPIVAAVREPGRKAAARLLRENVAGQWRALSRGARQMPGAQGRGVFSVVAGAGSRPGTSDAAYIPREEYARADEEDGEEARALQGAVLEALDAYDPGTEFLLQLVVGQEFGVYRVRHHESSPSPLPGERPLHLAQITD